MPIPTEGFDHLRDLIAGGDLPTEAATARRIGKYRLIREVGRGGMAIVHEAEDTDLHRTVALKVVPFPDHHPHLIARLRREAKIIAQLRHPNIVAVHEVGTARDAAGSVVHYIAMEFVAGPTLGRVLAEGKTSRDTLLRLLEDVARAAAHAHEQGVVHRDLKPGNVLIDERGRPRLVDFGLAYGEDFRTKLTASQSVLGTPQYMAPEQVRGDAEQVGPHTDVYALGVMLHEILTGRLPYEGRSVAELYRQILEEPVPLGALAATADPRLVLVCGKALEKDPTKRYATAQTFADDLARARFGQSISARAPGPWRRLRDGLAGHPAAGGAAGVALGLLLLAAVFLPRAWVQERQALDQLRKRTRTALDASLALRRAGSLGEMERFAAETEEACREAMRRLPDLAEPHYLLGRMHRAILQPEEAAAAQEAALAKDPGFLPAVYERIVLTAGEFDRRLKELHQWTARGARAEKELQRVRTAAAEDERAKALLARMQADCERLRRPPNSGEESLGPGQAAAAEGLLAWVTGDTTTARERLRAALAGNPDLDEATFALATVEWLDGAADEAVEVWTRGIERDHGYVPFLEGRGFAGLALGFAQAQSGRDPSARYAAAIADHRAALATGRAQTETWLRLGIAHFLAGLDRSERGQDPKAAFGDALRAFDEAEGHAPETQLLVWRGIVRTAWGRFLDAQDQDADPTFEKALADLNAALAIEAENANALLWRGVATAARALAGDRAAGDVEAVRLALGDLDRAVERDPGDPDARLWRGQLRQALALFDSRAGKEAEEAFAAALADLDEAVRLDPEDANSRSRRGLARAGWANARHKRGGDSWPLFEEAAEDFRSATRLNPARDEAWRGLARVVQVLADRRVEQGKDGADLYREAIAAGEKGRALAPGNAKNLEVLGAVHQGLAIEQARRGQSATEHFRKAIEAYEAAIKANPGAESRLRPHITRCRRGALR